MMSIPSSPDELTLATPHMAFSPYPSPSLQHSFRLSNSLISYTVVPRSARSTRELLNISLTTQTIPYPLGSPSTKSVSPQSRDEDVMWDSIKCFAEVWIDDITHSSLLHQNHNSVTEGHQTGLAQFALGEVMLAVTNDLLIFYVPQHSFHSINDLAEHRGETD
ncbi:hypothetical protein DUI87_18919 [Hirundo rustica rustica]|uniref:Uncharacterized protein n=1 Tax=Hirundo rustica rustica TaxID=333673 RepID=A0A3M0JZ82_HIRRU|nr:hypothetical protein DUI87_18919 [Hirundo rustica rustica]